MKGAVKKAAIFAISLTLAAGSFADDAAAKTSATAAPYASEEFPEWARQLRRAEIIGFGIFPFSVFFSTVGCDLYRFASHGFDMIYAPWPFKPDNAYNPTDSEKYLELSIAAALSLVAVGVDFYLDYLKHQAAAKASPKEEGAAGAGGEAPPGTAAPSVPIPGSQ
jgi:hypothetical protein